MVHSSSVSSQKIVLILVVVLLLIVNFALARELEQPLPGEQAPTTTEATLGEYISYIFQLSIMVAGFIAFGVFIYAGFRYLTSAGSPVAKKAAKKQMLGAIIGVALLLGSYLILRLIHHQFIGEDLEKPPPQRGVCFYNQGGATGERKCFMDSVKKMPDFDIQSAEFGDTNHQLRGIYMFGQEQWRGNFTFRENNKQNQSQRDIWNPGSVESFFLEWNKPGAWLFKKTNFEPDFPNKPYYIYNNSTHSLGKYNTELRSLRLKPAGIIKAGSCTPQVGPFGVVLHTKINYEGACRVIIPKGWSPGADCPPWEVNDLDAGGWEVNHNIRSMTLFEYGYQGNNSGQVTFYDRTNYRGDHFSVSGGQIGKLWKAMKDFDYPIDDSAPVAVEKGNQAIDNREMERILSVKIEGGFLVALGKDEDFGKDRELGELCEALLTSDPELSDNYVIRPERTKAHSILIIPLKLF